MLWCSADMQSWHMQVIDAASRAERKGVRLGKQAHVKDVDDAFMEVYDEEHKLTAEQQRRVGLAQADNADIGAPFRMPATSAGMRELFATIQEPHRCDPVTLQECLHQLHTLISAVDKHGSESRLRTSIGMVLIVCTSQ